MRYILLGQKNVGKSSIFNKLTGKKSNIVNSIEGSTRDWIEGLIKYKNKKYYLIDTPGFNLKSKHGLNKISFGIIKNNLKTINFILFVVDGRKLISNNDKEILRFLRKTGIDIILIINKVDNEKIKLTSNQFMKFGLKIIFSISCAHNIGIKQLNNFLLNNFDNQDNYPSVDSDKKSISVSVYGLQNAGKSTFINTFLGFNRFQTGRTPGITTDTIFHHKIYKSNLIKIYDTAGIKAKNKILDNLELVSSKKSINNISNTNVSILLIDTNKGLTKQDKRLINILFKKGKIIMVVFNKIDLINDKKIKDDLVFHLKNNIYQIKNLKYFFISAFKYNNVKKIFDFIILELTRFNKRISTSNINKWLKLSTKEFEHPLISKKKVNFKYALQTIISPITIKIFVNRSNHIKESYKRYLKNSFIQYFDIRGERIIFYFVSNDNPYLKK